MREKHNQRFKELISSILFQKVNDYSCVSTDEEKIKEAWNIIADCSDDDEFKEVYLIRNKNMMFPFVFPSINNNYDLLLFAYYCDTDEFMLTWLPAFLLHNHNMYKIFHFVEPEGTREILNMIKNQYDNYMKDFDKYRKSYITIGPEFAGISYIDIALAKLN